MSSPQIAFALLAALLAFTPTAFALAEDGAREEAPCLVRPEACPDHSGARLVTCTDPPVVIPICYTFA